MKSKIALLSIFALSATAFASINYAGKFSEPEVITIVGYDNEAACKADQGQWQDDMCWFETSNDVQVDSAVQILTVDVIAGNAHTCTFEGPIVSASGNKVISQTPSDEWNDTTGDFETVTCEVTATYSADGNSVAVDNNGNCRSFCGARAHLNISNAVRQL